MSIWVEAARPRTLPASIAPVLVGTAAADTFIAPRFVAALVVSVALQVAVNYANDLSDGLRGIDSPERAGPRRAVASGLVTPAQMKVGTAAALAVASIAGLALAAAVGYELLIVGLACLGAAMAYSGGPRPYASAGLGELFVFVFFGLVATMGSAYVQQEHLDSTALFAAIPVGLLASAILVANNLRDLSTDAAAGKRTLAVRLGPERTRTAFRALVLGAFPFIVLVAGATRSPGPLISFAAFPFVRGPYRAVASDEPPKLVDALVGTARLELLFSLLLSVGLWIS